MRLTEEEVNLAKAGDEIAISKLIETYEFMVKSPVYDAVLTILITTDSWCKEIRNERPAILGEQDSNDKAIERVRKFMLDLPQHALDCQKLQATLTGDDIKQLQHDRKIAEAGDRAFPTLNGDRK